MQGIFLTCLMSCYSHTRSALLQCAYTSESAKTRRALLSSAKSRMESAPSASVSLTTRLSRLKPSGPHSGATKPMRGGCMSRLQILEILCAPWVTVVLPLLVWLSWPSWLRRRGQQCSLHSPNRNLDGDSGSAVAAPFHRLAARNFRRTLVAAPCRR